jgi:GTP-binding protein Era
MKSGLVALIGRPNAGKSTLLNALVGVKLAIVSDKPQTTRTRILGVKTTPHAQLVFVDTPGVHRPLHRMNVRMVDAAREAIRSVDVVALIVDASEATGGGTNYLLELVVNVTLPLVLVLNKVDVVPKPSLLPLIDWFRSQREFADIVPVSALTGDGVPELERVLLSHLPDGEPLFPEDYLTDQPERRLAAEIVREQVLAETREELPFTTAVVVDGFEEEAARGAAASAVGGEPRGLIRVFCSILVERASQKPILIGRGGSMIKRIGTAARLELQRFFGTHVFLDLQVKVAPDWRENERVLDDLGLERPARARGGRGYGPSGRRAGARPRGRH